MAILAILWTESSYLNESTNLREEKMKKMKGESDGAGTDAAGVTAYMLQLSTQVGQGIITQEDWDTMKNDIVVDYVRDNHFTELRDAELLREKLQTMDAISNYVGEYFSKEWIQKNVLQFNDEEIEQINKQINGEQEEQEPEEEEQEQEAPPAPIVQSKPVEQPKNEQLELEFLMKEKELEVLENITQVLKS